MFQNNKSWEIYVRLLGYTSQYKRVIALSIIGFFVYAQTQWVWAELVKYIIESVDSKKNEAAAVISFAIITIFVLRGVGGFLGNWGLAYISRNVIYELRQSLFSKLMYLSATFLGQTSRGALIAKMTYDVEQVAGAASDACKVIVQEGFIVVGLLVYLFITQWKLTLMFMTVLPVIAIIVKLASKRLQAISKNIQQTVGDVSHHLNESIEQYELIKASAAESHEISTFARLNKFNLQQSLKLSVTQNLNTPIVQTCVSIVLALLVWVALQPSGVTQSGEFVAFLTAVGLLVKPLRQLTQVNAIIQKGIAGANSIFSMLDIQDYDPMYKRSFEGSGDNHVFMHKIEFRDVTFSYAGKTEPVLKKLSFVINKGDKVAFIGRSGSGKSTIVKLLMGFYPIDSGSILIDDVCISLLHIGRLRQQFAWVQQQPLLFNRTLAENISYGHVLDKKYLNKAAKKANILDYITSLPKGFDTVYGGSEGLLSGGQMQRLSIARAFYGDKSIFIWDEATSALDGESESVVVESLDCIPKDKTAIVIAHRLNTIKNMNKIFVMDEGVCVDSGSFENLSQHSLMFKELMG